MNNDISTKLMNLIEPQMVIYQLKRGTTTPAGQKLRELMNEARVHDNWLMFLNHNALPNETRKAVVELLGYDPAPKEERPFIPQRHENEVVAQQTAQQECATTCNKPKLSGDTAKDIRELLKAGLTQTEVANQLGVHRSTVNRIAKGVSYKVRS